MRQCDRTLHPGRRWLPQDAAGTVVQRDLPGAQGAPHAELERELPGPPLDDRAAAADDGTSSRTASIGLL